MLKAKAGKRMKATEEKITHYDFRILTLYENTTVMWIYDYKGLILFRYGSEKRGSTLLTMF